MTRKEILATYKTDKYGRILDLGKFEGEMLYAPYFYDVVMQGGGERIGDTDFIDIYTADKLEFPELADWYGITVVESGQGFVYVRAQSREDYDWLYNEAKKSDE